LRGKILLAAVLVGFCHATFAEAAFAPKENIWFVKSPKLYAQFLLKDGSSYKCVVKLWTLESHWNNKALNHKSGAYGIAQFLPTTWGNYKVIKTSNALKQIDYGLHYISVRYHSACVAWTHEQKYGWY
jgi:Transglycosylase SLT domain